MSRIIDADYLKSLPLPIKDAQWDKLDAAFLDEIIDTAEVDLENDLDIKVTETEWTERIRGMNSSRLILTHYPIVSLDAVTELDEVEGAIEHDLNAFLIIPRAGIVEWQDKARNWFTKERTYYVEYTAGWDPVPLPLKLATAYRAYELLQPMFRGSRDMQPVDFVPGTTEEYVRLTEPYRRKRIG